MCSGTIYGLSSVLVAWSWLVRVCLVGTRGSQSSSTACLHPHACTLWFAADRINLDVFSNKKCRCRPNSPSPEMTANLHFLIKLAASFYERGLGYANQMVVYKRLGEFGNKFHKC